VPQAPSPLPVDSGVARRRLIAGLGCGLATAVIWGVQSVVSRQSVADGMSAADVTILRFSVASLLLLPLALRRMRPFPVGRLGWRRALLLTGIVGAPYALILVGGANFAPALHAAICPGLIPVFTALLVYWFMDEKPGSRRIAGLVLVIAGVGAFSWQGLVATDWRTGVWIGDLLFLCNAALWSIFGLLARRWNVDPIDVTIATCLLSLPILPVFALTMPIHLGTVHWQAVALQAVYQGGLVGVGALLLYTQAVALLGAARATLFLPLNPVVSALAGALLLGEIQSLLELAGMALVMIGMMVALRAPSRG
jgi:drug/metabolite transporter (DMT)-like permease